MKKILIVVVIVIGFAGFAYAEDSKAINKSPFAFVQGFVMGDDYVQYQSDLAKIEKSYKSGEITKEKYLELKSDAEKSYKPPKQ